MEKIQEKKIAIYDGDFIPFYVCHNKKDEGIKTLDDCKRLCDELIANINKTINATHYIGFLTIGKCFRYEINPKYKANRKYAKLPEFLKEIKEHLINEHGFTFDPNYEADDLVLSSKRLFKDFETFIVSPDKDILNTYGTHYNPKINQYTFCSKEDAHLYFWKSMLTGDASDGIGGIKGIGPVGAKEILSEPNLIREYREVILDKYVEVYGEYEGIKEFTKNYLSLKLVDDIKIKVELKETMCEKEEV